MVYNTPTGGGDVLWTGTGTPGNTQNPGQTTNTQGTQTTTDTWDTYTDTGLPNNDNTGFTFLSLNGQPVLNPPQDNLSNLPTSLLFPQSLTNPTNGDPSQADLTYNSSFETELANLAPELNLTPEQVAQVKFAFNNPGAPGIPPYIQNLAQALSQNATLGYSAIVRPSRLDPPFSPGYQFLFQQAVRECLQSSVHAGIEPICFGKWFEPRASRRTRAGPLSS